MMRKSTTGFTIVELLVVIVVIGVLATISTVVYSGVQKRAKAAVTSVDLENIEKKIKVYFTEHESFPDSMQTLQDASFPATSKMRWQDNDITRDEYSVTSYNDSYYSGGSLYITYWDYEAERWTQLFISNIYYGDGRWTIDRSNGDLLNSSGVGNWCTEQVLSDCVPGIN